MAEQIKLRKRYKCTIDIQAELTNAGIDLVTAISMLNNIPDADVEEVVRCKDCEYYNTSGCASGLGWCELMNYGHMDDHYCNLGERKGQIQCLNI